MKYPKPYRKMTAAQRGWIYSVSASARGNNRSRRGYSCRCDWCMGVDRRLIVDRIHKKEMRDWEDD